MFCAVLCCCVSLCHVSGVEQCVQLKRTNGGLCNMYGLFCWTSGASDNPTWVNFGKPNWQWSSSRVYFQNVTVCTGNTLTLCSQMWTCCPYARGRFERTYGFCQRVSQTTHHHAPPQPQPQRQTTTTTTRNESHNQATWIFSRFNTGKLTRFRQSKDWHIALYSFSVLCCMAFFSFFRWFVWLLLFTTKTLAC